MPNAFTLFGELVVNTLKGESSLKRFDTSLKHSEKALERTERAAMRMGASSAAASRGIDKMRASTASAASSARALGSAMGTYGSVIIAAVGGFAIKTAVEMDSLKRGLTAVSGSADEAGRQLLRLKEVAKSPGLGFKEAIQGSINLQAAGLSAALAERSLTAFGNALATVGKGKAELEGVITALSQIQSKGKISAEEINQLAERLPQIRVAMKDAFGTADTEALEKLGVTSQQFIEKVVAAFEKLPQATSGAKDAFDNFKDSVERAITPLGDAILSKITPAMGDLAAELEKERPDLSSAAKKLGERLGQLVGEGIVAGARNLPKFGDWLVEQLKPPTAETVPVYLIFGKSLAEAIVRGFKTVDIKSMWNDLRQSWLFSLTTIGPQLAVTAYGIGRDLVQGFINGIRSLFSSVGATMGELGSIAETAARSRLDTRSPSKVFFGIGKDVVQGFVDGIAAMKASAQSAMASLLDVSGLKLGKVDAAGVELLSELINEVARYNATSKEQQVNLDLTAGKYGKLNNEVRERIKLAAKEIDRLELINNGMEKVRSVVDEFISEFAGGKTQVELVTAALGDKGLQAALGTLDPYLANAIKRMALFNAQMADAAELAPAIGVGIRGGIGSSTLSQPDDGTLTDTPSQQFGIPPPPVAAWENFWATMRQKMEDFKASLPSLKQALGENLVASIENIGSVFGNAIATWDGTAKGFFKSLAQGFRQMVSQIVAELVRLMVMKAIMQIIGAFAGSAFGSSGAPGTVAVPPPPVGAADGGLILGRGTSTSDSIPARLSNGEFVMSARAVKKWGVGFFDDLNSMQPQMAFANGGYVSGFGRSSSMVTNNNTSNQPINVYVQGGGSREQNQQTGYQIAKAMRMKLEHDVRRNK